MGDALVISAAAPVRSDAFSAALRSSAHAGRMALAATR